MVTLQGYFKTDVLRYTSIENYQFLKFLLLVLLDDMFQQLQADVGIHSVSQLPERLYSHIIGKIEALQLKNKEKKTTNKKKTNNEAKSGYSRVQFPLVVLQLLTYPQIVKLMWSKVLLWAL